jgi:hypothetical protein
LLALYASEKEARNDPMNNDPLHVLCDKGPTNWQYYLKVDIPIIKAMLNKCHDQGVPYVEPVSASPLSLDGSCSGLDELVNVDVALENFGLQALLRTADVNHLSLTPTFLKQTTRWQLKLSPSDGECVVTIQTSSNPGYYIGLTNTAFGLFDKQPV